MTTMPVTITDVLELTDGSPLVLSDGVSFLDLNNRQASAIVLQTSPTDYNVNCSFAERVSVLFGTNDDILYENGDTMLYENGDTMIFALATINAILVNTSPGNYNVRA
jgi:hypothetical protein